jgi:hypothetical protein
MKIDCELSQEESDALCMALGAGTAILLTKFKSPTAALTCVRVMNKLYALSPDYRPYDESGFDPDITKMPLRPMPPQ